MYDGLHYCRKHGGKPAAPQPEAPTLAPDELLRRLEASEGSSILRAAAKRIRELEAEIDEQDALRNRLDKLLTGVANALKGEPPPLTLHSWHDLPELAAASRERWKAESERADRLWQECENLRIRLADAQHRPVVDKSGDSQGSAVDKPSNSQGRMRRCFGCEGFYLPAHGHTCAHTTIPPEIATPDSAASPTGGEGGKREC